MNRIINVICFTPNGGELANKIRENLQLDEVRCYGKSSVTIADCYMLEENLEEFARDSFDKSTALIVVGAAGIASRMIAPCVKDKLSDIAVVVVDELATFVIPILSGHAGGANDLAMELSQILNAVPVITTATDINEKFAIDVYAEKNGLRIVNKDGIKKVSRKVLENKTLTICIKDYPCESPVDILITDDKADIATSDVKKSDNVDNGQGYTQGLQASLYLKPKKYVLGIGCRQGKSSEELKGFVEKILSANNIKVDDIYAVASIERKKDEQAIIELASSMKIPFITFESSMLERVEGDFTSSEFVKQTVGVDNVCERSAVLAAGRNGCLIIKKCTENGMSLAIAERR